MYESIKGLQMPLENTRLRILPKIAKFIPEWPFNHLTKRNCPLCDIYSEPLFLRSDLLPISFCKNCSLWYVSKNISDNLIKQIYHDYYKTIRATSFNKKYSNQIKQLAKLQATNAWKDIRLSKLLAFSENLSGKRVLDTGCGNGQFMYTLSLLGADVIGCEPSADASTFIKNELGLKILSGSIEENIEKIGVVDVITMNDVIEHFTNPLMVLKRLCSILNNNGLIVISTPNAGEAGIEINTAMNWAGFGIDLEHLQYFSTDSIVRICKLLDLELIHLDTFGVPNSSKMVYNENCHIKKIFSNFRFSLACALEENFIGRNLKAIYKQFANKTKVGSFNLFVILRKNSL